MSDILNNIINAINPGFKTSDYNSMNYTKFDFYSGSQITVWMENICIDDIVSIGWTRSQSKKPIYGYASQQFDGIAKGIVQIDGSFIVNFRQAGYISMIMERIQELYSQLGDKRSWETVRNLIGLHLKNDTFGPKTSEELRFIGDSPSFEAMAKAYEDTVWGVGAPTDSEPWGPVVPPADVYQSRKMPDGFTIVISYGNSSGSSNKTLVDYTKSTTKTLVGVHLTGESQVIQVGGQPIMEQYNFIARGTDEQLGNER